MDCLLASPRCEDMLVLGGVRHGFTNPAQVQRVPNAWRGFGAAFVLHQLCFLLSLVCMPGLTRSSD